MPTVKSSPFDHAVHTANTWIRDVAAQFGTEDRHFVHRILRAWLHTLRDRITVEATAHFAAQLPELLRGIYYEGWNPSAVPDKYDASGYLARFAREANVSAQDAHRAVPVVTAVVLDRLSPNQVSKVLDQLPVDIRALLRPSA